jgi:hypothetical protein
MFSVFSAFSVVKYCMRIPGTLVGLAAIAACAPPRDSMTADRPDSLRLHLLAPAAARAGAPVPITIRVANGGGRPLELHLQGRGIAFDVVVKDEAGTVVWRRLEGAFIQGILQLKTLAPGESFDLDAAWTPTAPGTYTVEGVLPTDEPQPLRTPVARVTVTPGG